MNNQERAIKTYELIQKRKLEKQRKKVRDYEAVKYNSLIGSMKRKRYGGKIGQP
ncbi:MAG: hypothetical protein ACRCW0_02055 [Clostridium sp.]